MFRFSIRDVLWLTVVVALLIGWLLDHHQLREAVVEVNARLQGYERRAELRLAQELDKGFQVITIPLPGSPH
jgi:hypothetical protein